MNMETEVEIFTDEPSKFVKGLLEWIEELILAVIFVAVLFTFVLRVITVTGSSMVPNYNEDDRVAVSSVTFSLNQGDVIVISNVLDDPIIKRVIATEGQTVDFDYERGAVIIDGEILDDSKFGIENGITTTPFNSIETVNFPQTVPKGCVFVLGDNRTVSEDSRYKDVGMIDKRNILGKAVFKIFPFSEMGLAK